MASGVHEIKNCQLQKQGAQKNEKNVESSAAYRRILTRVEEFLRAAGEGLERNVSGILIRLK